MDSVLQKTFSSQFKINGNGISEFTMEQIKAKSAAMGLTSELTAQTVAIAKDADFSAKAATGKLTWLQAANDAKINAEELGEALKKSGKLGEESYKALEKAGSESIESLGEKTREIIKDADFADEFIELGGVAETTGKNMSSVFTGVIASLKSMLPLIGAVASAFLVFEGIKWLDDKFTLTEATAQRHLEESSSAYSSTISEIQSMNSELETTNQRISELKDKGQLTLTEQTELDRLEKQNSLLETQLEIKQKLADEQGKKTAEDAREAINFKSEKLDMINEDGTPVVDRITGDIKKKAVDRKEYVRDLQKSLEQEQKIFDDAKKKLDSQELNEDGYDLYSKQLKLSQKNIEEYKETISSMLSDLNDEAKSFYNQETGEIISGFEKDVEEINKLNDVFNNFDLSPMEKELKSIESYFNLESTSFISDQFKEMANQGKLTADEVKRLGFEIDGVDAETIAKYFNDMAKSADETVTSISKFGTLDEYTASLESENAGDNYLKIVEGLEKTKELYDKGLVGTDDFKSFAKMLSPTGATDAENFIENYNNLKKYFDSDSASGMNNFLTDLSKKTDDAGKSFASFDKETKQWSIDIEDTADAAKKLGIGIAPFESMLGRLQDYGFDIDFRSALQDLTDVETALNGFDDILDRMEDGSRKDALSEQVEGWKSQLSGWKDDLSTLNTDIVMKIKLEYNLAEIQAQIDEFRSNIDWGNATSENYAGLLSGNEKYINTSKKSLGLDREGINIPVEYTTTEDTIEVLKNQLAEATSEEEKVKIQAEISNLQELQKELLDAFSDTHPEINAESSLEETRNALDSFFASTKGKEITAKMTVDSTDFTNKVDSLLLDEKGFPVRLYAEDNVTPVIDDIEKRELIDKHCALYSDDYATGIINYWNSLYADPKFTIMTAEDQATYVINNWNNLTPAEKTGYIKTEVSATDDATPKLQSVDKLIGSMNLKPNASITATDSASSKILGVNNTLKTLNGKSAHTYIYAHTKTINDNVAKLNGTAHVNGTSGLYPIPKLSGRALAMGTLEDDSWLKPQWKTKNDEFALTGELGQEIVVHGNRWWTVGDNGAEFSSIPQGSVVFDHNQTKELLKNGKINARGKSYLSGTAYAGGATGGGSLSGGASGYNKPNSSNSSSSSTKSSSSDKASEKSEKASEKIIDFVEIAIKRLKEGIKRIKITAESVFKTFTKRNEALGQEMSAIVNKINLSQQAYNKYMSQANSVGLSKSYASQVRNGSINIATITDEDLSKKISDYQEW